MHFLPKKRAVMVLLAVAAVLLLPLAAQAVTYGFSQLTNNGSPATASQYLVNVTGYNDPITDTNDVLFLFTNVGSVASSICDIYFDDGHLLALSQTNVNNVGVLDGVAFSRLAHPNDLPSGNNATPDFVTTAGFSADSDSPVSTNGVGLGEATGIVFALKGAADINSVLADLNNGALRIGLHVQAIGPCERSESFVNNPVPFSSSTAPVPPTVLLLGSGLVGLGLLGWRRRKQ